MMAPAGGTAARQGNHPNLLAELLHALNQPLTGLQCSMEVALAAERTPEEYVRCLREGLELTERMRALVEALREVAEGDGGAPGNEPETGVELGRLVREAVEELRPVAAAREIQMAERSSSRPQFSDVAVSLRAGAAGLAPTLFRLFDAVVSLAMAGSELGIEMAAGERATLRIEWRQGRNEEEYSRPELGLMVARAALERAGAEWERARMGGGERLTVSFPRALRRHGGA